MTYIVQISANETNKKECALISIFDDLTNTTVCCVDINLRALIYKQQIPSDTVLDLLVIASVVYTLDRAVERKDTDDRWTRNFSIRIPVHSVQLWSRSSKILSECLCFLSGDEWSIAFEKRTCSMYREIPRKRKSEKKMIEENLPTPHAVSLFSGGIDSLVGVIDWLEENDTHTIAAVGHHDTTIAGTNSVQETVLENIDGYYQNRIIPFFSGIGPLRVKGQKRKDRETTTRSRSFMFLTMGVFVADMVGTDIPVLIPENGTIALNVPLTPSRRGSCSTRTAHPYYIHLFQKLLSKLKLKHTILNPLLHKSKGEVVSGCRNQLLLHKIIANTVSCAKSGHTRWWRNYTAHSCGACMPCIYRRAALHKVGLDMETYGYDICCGDVDLDDRKSKSARDLRACLFFLSKNYSSDDIARILWTQKMSSKGVLY